ncbi:MAG: hypothetical protein U5Q44_02210 [Dehalococcoidia bacterium]|nr:hypothetical protein [Dehalococcoidia bacterium]
MAPSLILAAVLLLTQVNIDMSRWRIAANMVMLGAGIGLVLPTMSVACQNALPYQYLGVATSMNQFSRQMGAVIGVAIFGVILAGTYDGAFERELPEETRQQVPPVIVAEFENPTVALDEQNYERLQGEVQSLPNGDALLASTTLAVRRAVEEGTRNVFYAATVIAIVCVVLALTLKEIPLRRTVRSAEESPPPEAAADAAEPEGSGSTSGAPGS